MKAGGRNDPSWACRNTTEKKEEVSDFQGGGRGESHFKGKGVEEGDRSKNVRPLSLPLDVALL